MRTSTVILAAVAVAFATASGALWRELSLERERVDALSAKLSAAGPRNPPTRESSFSDIDSAPALEADEPDAPPRPDLDGPPPREDTDGRPRERGFRAPNFGSPEFRAAYRDLTRLELEDRHRDLAAVLRLSPQEADALLDLMAKQAAEAMASRRRGPLDDAQREQRRLETEQRLKANDEELRNLLGQQKFKELKQYQETLDTRLQVSRLRSQLASGNDPLRNDQVEPLVEAVAAEQQRLSEEAADFRNTLDWSESSQRASRERYDAKYRELEAATNSRIRSAASSILSASQLSTYTREMERQRAMSEARARMRSQRQRGAQSN
jgi:hypothetical protein